jgi:glycosyltransferase involved in cell wall biosynthesis
MAGAISVIPNGVDTRAFVRDGDIRARVRSQLGVSDSELVAMFVGVDWDRKGLQYAIEAVARVPAWRLLVVGPGEVVRYREIALRAGANGRVMFLGRKSDTAPYFAAADGFVMPTAYEAFPLVTLEATAAGLPLLVSQVSGMEELIVAGENGWFIGRDAYDIAERLRELARNRAEGRRWVFLRDGQPLASTGPRRSMFTTASMSSLLPTRRITARRAVHRLHRGGVNKAEPTREGTQC